jgi:hypothetical protein
MDKDINIIVEKGKDGWRWFLADLSYKSKNKFKTPVEAIINARNTGFQYVEPGCLDSLSKTELNQAGFSINETN